MIITKRLIVVAGAVSQNPFDASDPQVSKVLGVVGVAFDPAFRMRNFSKFTEVPPPPETFDFWDVLVLPDFSSTGYLRLYEATLADNSQIDVVRDFFGLNDF